MLAVINSPQIQSIPYAESTLERTLEKMLARIGKIENDWDADSDSSERVFFYVDAIL